MSDCYICRQAGATEHTGQVQGLIVVNVSCPRCGTWCGALDLVVPDIRGAHPNLIAGLQAYIRQANELGQKVVQLTSDNWRQFAEEHTQTPVPRKLEMLLRWYERQSAYAGDVIETWENIYPLVDAQNDKEVVFLRATLAKQGLIETEPSKQAGIQISAKGWEYLHPPSAGGIRGVCFVAMSFDHSLNEVYEDGIRKALEIDCGYTALRVDRVHHNDVITDRIVAGIREAQFVVADFTLHRPAVYYEAGFAKGLGREVVRTCRDTDFDKLCFDTRQFMHIKWTEAADLRSALSAHIKGTLGRFVNAKGHM
jgi:nucleoside 2-deoxyribosyltransferase